MILGCKTGCLCSDINKEYCCRECDKNNDCESSCEIIQRLFSKNEILKSCKNSFLVSK